MLELFDIALTMVHLLIILFNLFGWIFKKTQRAHLISIILTAASWFILGIWFGPGYCPFTDWQWQVKRELGQTNLPPNFIEYFAEKISGIDFAGKTVNIATLSGFLLAALLSVYVNFFRRTSANMRDTR